MNPFLTDVRNFGGERMEATGADDRVRMLARFDADQCAAALALPDLQATVRTALERRARKLSRVPA